MKQSETVKDQVQLEQVPEQSENITDNATSEEQDQQRFKYETYSGIPVIPEILIERSKFKSNGKEYYDYKLHSIFNGRDLYIGLTAGTFYQNGKSYTDKEIYDQLDDIFEIFDDIRFGIKVYDDGKNKKTVEYYVIGVAANGANSPVPVRISRLGGVSKLSLLLSDIAIRYNAKPIIVF